MARGVSAVAGGAARRPKLTIALWLVLIAACLLAGAQVGTRMLSDAASGTGQSAQAQSRLSAAGLRAPAVENVLVRSSSAAKTTRAVTALERRARALPSVASVRGPAQAPALSRAGGRTALVQVQVRGDPDNADEHVAPLEAVVAQVAALEPGVRLQEAGLASGGHAINQVVDTDLHHAELISLPITLFILLLAFGALVAAVVPLLLGLTSVAGALGALGLVSHVVPEGSATASVVVLIGLAVGVDYSLFYIRREREERRGGRDADAALTAATASVGRAIVVAAMTVIIGLAGLLFTGLGVFTSMALGAIIVVAIAALGSVTVLPAVLALLGDRIDRGRLWRRRRHGRGRDAHGRDARPGAWQRIATAITARPRAALLVTVAVLGALALPVLGMRTADPGEHDLSAHNPVPVAEQAIERAFPGAPDDAQLVVAGHHLGRPPAQRALRALGQRAEAVTRGHGAVGIEVSRDGDTALVSVPFADRGLAPQAATVAMLRSRVDPTLAATLPGSTVQVTGDAAENVDFSGRLDTATPIVIALVLGLAFVLLVAAFGSPRLAAGVIALNLLSVGAAFGILVEVFQHGVGHSVLGFTSDGAIVEWLPLFAFVVLFGLSMDYTVLILERVREARAHGADARSAAVQALGATAGTVTSAAAVMVGVFAIFATLNLLEFKQLGFGLAIAILLDATIVRAVALPAVVTLLGGRAGGRAPTPRAAWFRRPMQETALR
ncbi:MAG TPA: MMPL family transporter [Solirubrobacteraceae bacterium]|nr:MMPL family transporter [Solirubrobacteraceae bacterium]